MNYSENLALLSDRFRALRQQLKREGTTGMSVRNAISIVDTRGVDVPPSAFHRLAEDAVRAADPRSTFFYVGGDQ